MKGFIVTLGIGLIGFAFCIQIARSSDADYICHPMKTKAWFYDFELKKVRAICWTPNGKDELR